MKKLLLKSLLLVLAVILVFAQVLTGCGKKGQLSGRIYESGTEALITGKVIVTVGRQSITVNNGEYSFKDVPVGTQTLKVQAEGYKIYTVPVKIDEDQTTKHNVSLQKEDPTFAYVVGYTDPSYSIYAYAVNAASGGLTPIIGGQFSEAEMKNPCAFLTDADGKFLYVANNMDPSVSVFAIDPATGYLAPITGSPFATNNNPRKLAMSPEGGFVAVGCNYNLNIFSRDQSNGALSDRQVFPLAPDEEMKEVIFDMTGNYLYAAVSTGYIYVYGKNPDGTFAQIAGSPLATRPNPSDLAFGLEGDFLYATSAGSTAMGYHSVNGNGSLGAVTNINLSGQTTDCVILGNIFYTNPAFKKLEAYTIKADGTFSYPIGSALNFADDIDTLTVDPAKKHLYVTTWYTDDIWVLDINSDGTLAQPADSLIDAGFDVNALILVKPVQ